MIEIDAKHALIEPHTTGISACFFDTKEEKVSKWIINVIRNW